MQGHIIKPFIDRQDRLYELPLVHYMKIVQLQDNDLKVAEGLGLIVST